MNNYVIVSLSSFLTSRSSSQQYSSHSLPLNFNLTWAYREFLSEDSVHSRLDNAFRSLRFFLHLIFKTPFQLHIKTKNLHSPSRRKSVGHIPLSPLARTPSPSPLPSSPTRWAGWSIWISSDSWCFPDPHPLSPCHWATSQDPVMPLRWDLCLWYLSLIYALFMQFLCNNYHWFV